MIVTTQKASEMIKAGGKEVYLYDPTGRVLGLFELCGWKNKNQCIVYLRDQIDNVVIEANLKDLAIL